MSLRRVLFVDGYNLLLTEFKDAVDDLSGARREVVRRLEVWREARRWEVVVVWDGHRMLPSAEEPSGAVRVHWANPPAEADDVIVQYAAQWRVEGWSIGLCSRDRGLARRLGREVEKIDMDKLARDLCACDAAPIRLPHVTGIAPREIDFELAAASDTNPDDDPLSWPRRRLKPPDSALPIEVGAPHVAARGARRDPPPPTDGSPSGGSPAHPPTVEEKKLGKRARYARAQARKQKR